MRETRTEAYSVTIERDEKTGEILLEEWTDATTGEFHREGGPARTDIEEFEGRNTRLHEYYRQGRLHRDNNECAYVVTDIETGSDIINIWYRNGWQHREPGPDGSLPSYIKRDVVTGIVVVEEYRFNDLYHREDGPAFIMRDRVSGRVTRSSTYLNGSEIVDTSSIPKPTI